MTWLADSKVQPGHSPACLSARSQHSHCLRSSVEIGDWERFNGNTIASFVGLVPSERSSGQSRSQ